MRSPYVEIIFDGINLKLTVLSSNLHPTVGDCGGIGACNKCKIHHHKIFDHDNDGKIEVSELRFALCRLGQPLEENLVDDLIAELDREKTGLVDIMDWAKITFK